MKNIIVILFVTFLGVTANAQDLKKNKNAKVTFQVSGICEMCKKRIEKAALSVKGVKSANWNTESNAISLLINEQKVEILSVQKAIANAGHDNDGAKASDESYNKLHGCCQYERK